MAGSGSKGERAAGGETGSNALYAMVPGVPADLPLSAFATRFGIMVGAPTFGEDRGGCPAGTATLNSDMTGGGFDSAFSGTGNIDRGTAHTVETELFTVLKVGPTGKQEFPCARKARPVHPRPLS